MDAGPTDASVAYIAAAIAEPARARMLCCLMDGHARTSTELAVVAEVSPSTASVHLARLRERRLVKLTAQGRYRYYSLADERVAAALEALLVLSTSPPAPFVPGTPSRLRWARTCYDHMAGTIAVSLHDRLLKSRWLTRDARSGSSYHVTALGWRGMASLGVDVEAVRGARRRLACPCLDWSERRPHIGGGVGAALLHAALRRRWFVKDLDNRALRVTKLGRAELFTCFGLNCDP
ncbi:MAG TPA: helix-turn-helix domain-containing protein [Steroidobacteraceae bacterium]|jgi:DNA-binding transcriptional ArsR family regulator